MYPIRLGNVPALQSRLSKAKLDRIRFSTMGPIRRQSGAKNIENLVREEMLELDPSTDCSSVNDLLVGVARAARADIHNAKPLSVSRLYNLLQCMPLVNTRAVMQMMQINQRAAQRYVWAVHHAMPALIQHFDKQRPEGNRSTDD